MKLSKKLQMDVVSNQTKSKSLLILVSRLEGTSHNVWSFCVSFIKIWPYQDSICSSSLILEFSRTWTWSFYLIGGNIHQKLIGLTILCIVKLYLSVLSFSFFISKRERDTIITLYYHSTTTNFLVTCTQVWQDKGSL